MCDYMKDNKEYLKLYWKHDYPTDPVVIIYEVDLYEDRYATRLIDIYADRRVVNREDREFGFVTEAAVPTVKEFNTTEYGEEFFAQLISESEFEEIWNTGIYKGELAVELNNKNIVKVGLCRYGEREYRVYICKSDVLYGTGDYEDELTGADKEKECFSVWYEDILHPGKINAGGGYYETFEAAVKKAENSSGFKEWKQGEYYGNFR